MPEKRYTVESVVNRYVPGVAGGFTDVVTVTFVTPRGYRGSIDIPRNQASAEAVRKAIEADVARVEGIFQLG